MQVCFITAMLETPAVFLSVTIRYTALVMNGDPQQMGLQVWGWFDCADTLPERYSHLPASDTLPERYSHLPASDTLPERYSHLPASDTLPERYSHLPASDTLPERYSHLPASDTLPERYSHLPASGSIIYYRRSGNFCGKNNSRFKFLRV